MSYFATNEELALKSKLFPFSEVPLSFNYGGRPIRGIPEDFTVRTEGTDLYAINKAGLEIHAQYTEYEDFPATEWLVTFTNRGTAPTPIISDIRLGGILPLDAAILGHGNGDTHEMGCYRWYKDPLDRTIELSPIDGTSCKGAAPYMCLTGKDWSVNVAVGWSSKWVAAFEPVTEGVRISVGQARCHMRIYPGETIRVPRLTLVAYRGDEIRGGNMWRRWYLKYILPRPMKPLCCIHLYNQGGHPEWTGADEAGQLTAFDRYLEKGIRPDVWWMDAGWYPCDYNWRALGDWQPDPIRFPNGLGPIGKKCGEQNIDFLLWFEPERVIENSPFALEHPQWVLRTKIETERQPGNLLVDLGNRECCDYIIDLVDRIIKESGTTIYRQDFNFDPYPRWVAYEAPDRVGVMENLHIQGYYRFWDTLVARNPGLLIDSCASGGRRNDLETMRRSVTLHYTDVGYGIHPTKQLQHQWMFRWIPYFRAHVWSWDDPVTGVYSKETQRNDEYAFYCALAPAITDMLRYNDDDALYALSKKMQPIWRQAAQLMLSCDYYPLTACRESQEDFYAMAFYNQAAGKGFLNVVSNNRNPETEFTAVLDMLDADKTYTLTEAESGAAKTYSGKELLAFKVILKPRSGVVYFIEEG